MPAIWSSTRRSAYTIPISTTARPGQTSTVRAFSKGLNSFPSKRIASDGKPIEVTDTPYGLSENSGVKNSIVQPVMARDISRAGTEIYVAPCYKLTYDEDGYCVKMTTCAIPEDIAAKLAELNK